MAVAALLLASAAAPSSAVPQPSNGAAQVASWAVKSGDNLGLPFIIIDKVAAALFVYDGAGLVLGATPALLGAARGDDSVPGIGNRAMSAIGPDARTTPAGRFVAKFGPGPRRQRVLWVDYATSIALHPVVTTNRKERRLQRLRSAASTDNRITYGCINVPAAFYRTIVHPLFMSTEGVVYILPETRPLNAVFPSLPVQAQPGAGPEIAR